MHDESFIVDFTKVPKQDAWDDISCTDTLTISQISKEWSINDKGYN